MYDIYLRPLANAEKPFGFYYKQALMVTGKTKMAQRFMRCLLTPVGTDLEGYWDGTGLADLIGGNVADLTYLSGVVTSSVASAVAQLKRLNARTSDRVVLENARVTKISLSGTTVTVYLELNASDGTSMSIVLPLDNAATASTASSVTWNGRTYGVRTPT